MYRDKEGGWDTSYPAWYGVILNRMWWKRLNLFRFSCWTYQYPCVEKQYLKEEPNHAVSQETTLQFPRLLCFFQNLESNSMTFPGLEKENEIPWLFQVFHDWIHPVRALLGRGFKPSSCHYLSLSKTPSCNCNFCWLMSDQPFSMSFLQAPWLPPTAIR